MTPVACTRCGQPLKRYEVGLCAACARSANVSRRERGDVPGMEHISAVVARVMATLQVKKAA